MEQHARRLPGYKTWPEGVAEMVDEVIAYMRESGAYYTTVSVAAKVNLVLADKGNTNRITGPQIVIYARNVHSTHWTTIVGGS